MKLTQVQLEAIHQRAENATPGPWQIATTTDGAYVLDTDDMIIAATIERTEDATFIANARTDIPVLLDHIAELEAELASIKQTDKVRELYEWAKTAQKKFAKEGEYTKAEAVLAEVESE